MISFLQSEEKKRVHVHQINTDEMSPHTEQIGFTLLLANVSILRKFHILQVLMLMTVIMEQPRGLHRSTLTLNQSRTGSKLYSV